jgi:hypothetical protein
MEQALGLFEHRINQRIDGRAVGYREPEIVQAGCLYPTTFEPSAYEILLYANV